jgi:hypothetical protein
VTELEAPLTLLREIDATKLREVARPSFAQSGGGFLTSQR